MPESPDVLGGFIVGDSTSKDAPEIEITPDRADLQITPEMIKAGASVLYELEGEASKEAQAAQVFRAMLAASLCPHLRKDNSEAKGGCQAN